MDLESKVFQCRRFDTDAMLKYGFYRSCGAYVYEEDFMNGDFRMTFSVTEKGECFGRVIDRMNEEEYVALRNENYNGSYVNEVRSAYQVLLEKIARACCVDVLFATDQANRITQKILDKFGVRPDFPRSEDPHDRSGVFRHPDTGKWFGLIMHVKWSSLLKNKKTGTVDAMNLKVDPEKRDELVAKDGILPAYHMNHKLWITVILDDTLPDEEVMARVEESFLLTKKGPRK